jgi:hypothetical protein
VEVLKVDASADRGAFLARGRALILLLDDRPKPVDEHERNAQMANEYATALAAAALRVDDTAAYFRYERDVAGPAELAASEAAMEGHQSRIADALREAARLHIEAARDTRVWHVGGGGAVVQDAYQRWVYAWSTAERRVADAQARIAQADLELKRTREWRVHHP